MDLQTLSDQFAIPGVLAFSQNEHGLLRANITTPACTAEFYLQGAHITQWQPTGEQPVLFLSERSFFSPGKAIRGGIPIIFPWFGARTATPDDPRIDGPSHGFARTSDWTLTFAALAGNDLHITLTLAPSETSRSLGYDQFTLVYEITFGIELHLKLTVNNQAGKPLHFEEALHTYFSVGDSQQISIIGLSDTEYLDKTDGFKKKHQTDPLLKLTGETDRPYLNTLVPVNIDDPRPQAPHHHRQIRIKIHRRLEPVVHPHRHASRHESPLLANHGLRRNRQRSHQRHHLAKRRTPHHGSPLLRPTIRRKLHRRRFLVVSCQLGFDTEN